MSPAVQIGLIAGLMGGLLALMAGLRRIATAKGWAPEVQRKIVHVAAGSLAMALPWLFADDWPVYTLLALTLIAMIAMRTRLFAGLGKTLHSVERKSYGDYLLVIAVGFVFLFHGGEPILYVLPLAILTLADAAAAVAGSAYGRHFFTVEDGQKSIEGSVVFFLVTVLTSMVCLLLVTEVPRPNVIVLAVAIAVFATLVEADSWRGFDNLFLPLGVLIFLASNLVIPIWDAALRMAFLLAAIAIIFALSRRLGLGAHVARVHGMAFFLLLSVTAIQNAFLPALMLLAQALAGRVHGGARDTDALDIVGALALVSFGFLALGIALGPSALNFYGIATGAMAAGHGALALAHRPLWQRLFGAGLIALALFGLWTVVVGMNSYLAVWYPRIDWAVAAIFAMAAVLPAVAPRAIYNSHNIRVAALGTLPAVALYLGLFLMEGPHGP